MTKIPTLGWAKQDFWALDCFFDQNSNHIINQDSTEIICLDNRKSSYFSADKMAFWLELRLTKKFFLLDFWKSDVRFSKTYLPTLSYYVRFCLRYLPTQKSDILYGRSLWKLRLVFFEGSAVIPGNRHEKSKVLQVLIHNILIQKQCE